MPEPDDPRPSDVARFPADFLWGAATASYQVEGACHVDGRGESIWDRFSRTPGKVLGGDSGDVACDHYQRFEADFDILTELGLGAYRFSIAWPRILPEGTGRVEPRGLDFYDRLVDALLARGIEPMATLYHWDLPQALEDRGGWPMRETAEAFGDYAGVVAARLGDRVRWFATINEPWVISELGYRQGIHAPGRTDPSAANATTHHILVAHGLGVGAIRAAAPDAQVGIVMNFEPKHPATSHPLDLEAAAVKHDQMNRWFLDPLTGQDYPDDGARGFGWDRAEVLGGDLGLIAAPIDFLGVNYYTREVVRSPELDPLERATEPERTSMGWEVYPDGLTEVLRFVASRTGDLPLYVTENGAAYPADPADPASDARRVSFLHRHLAASRAAIDQGVPLRGYFVWSLLDNFEWAFGYSQRFGIVHVDYETQDRVVRDSARFLAEVARTGALPPVAPTSDDGG